MELLCLFTIAGVDLSEFEYFDEQIDEILLGEGEALAFEEEVELGGFGLYLYLVVDDLFFAGQVYLLVFDCVS
jgi:hypothetical protein